MESMETRRKVDYLSTPTYFLYYPAKTEFKNVSHYFQNNGIKCIDINADKHGEDPPNKHHSHHIPRSHISFFLEWSSSSFCFASIGHFYTYKNEWLGIIFITIIQTDFLTSAELFGDLQRFVEDGGDAFLPIPKMEFSTSLWCFKLMPARMPALMQNCEIRMLR